MSSRSMIRPKAFCPPGLSTNGPNKHEACYSSDWPLFSGDATSPHPHHPWDLNSQGCDWLFGRPSKVMFHDSCHIFTPILNGITINQNRGHQSSWLWVCVWSPCAGFFPGDDGPCQLLLCLSWIESKLNGGVSRVVTVYEISSYWEVCFLIAFVGEVALIHLILKANHHVNVNIFSGKTI